MPPGLREKILLAGSIIAGITALTTSLRALGMSRREKLLQEIERLRTGSRLGNIESRPGKRHNILFQPIASTAIWFIISVAAAIPVIRASGESANIFLFISPFAILLLIVIIIWIKISRQK